MADRRGRTETAQRRDVAALKLTIVATDLDPGSERIVTYLRTFGVPVNAIFFSYLEDDGRRYLARSWLARDDDRESGGTAYGRSQNSKRAEWNGRDWFVSFGDEPGGRSWADGRTFGFVSAGGDAWYSRSLRNPPVDARVNVHIPSRGYVGVGIVTGPAARFDEAKVDVDGREVALSSLPLQGTYRHTEGGDREPDDRAEWVLPVRWLTTVPIDEAYWEKGMFANQNSACKLRQQFTLDRAGRGMTEVMPCPHPTARA